MSSNLEVKQYADSDFDRWDAFVEACPEATFFHRAGWKVVIERSFGHKTHYLYVEEGGHIRGVLPLAHVKSLLFGNALISCPFCVYGGVAAETDGARCALEKAAKELAFRLGVDYLEFRNFNQKQADWPTKDLYVTFRKEIDPDSEKNYLAIPRKQRAMVRKGIDAGLLGEVDNTVDRFYQVYSRSMRDLGTPVSSKRYFIQLKSVFGDDCEISVVNKQKKPISAVMSFYFRDEVLPYYGGGVPEARALKGYDFMYWNLMERASGRGIRIFDYGRSKRDSGSYQFKKHWGFSPQPLHYEYCLVRAATIPDISPNNPKYHQFIELWKRLPLTATRILGPFLARSLG